MLTAVAQQIVRFADVAAGAVFLSFDAGLDASITLLVADEAPPWQPPLGARIVYRDPVGEVRTIWPAVEMSMPYYDVAVVSDGWWLGGHALAGIPVRTPPWSTTQD